MNNKERIVRLIARVLAVAYPEAEGLPGPDAIETALEIPPDNKLGDYAFPCFRLSKPLRKAPPVIAARLLAVWGETGAGDAEAVTAEAVGGYLNFFFDREGFAREVLGAVGPEYGRADIGRGAVVVLDYSSINIAKRFHIGHLSTTMIGHALKRILEHVGYRTVGINHLGDWGTQFGKMICAYKRWGSREMVEAGGVDAMTALYVRFHQEAEADPALEDEGRAWFKRIEDGDPEALRIFTWFKDVTLEDARRVYDMLGVTFDAYTGESFYNDKMDRVIRELDEKGLLTESNGAKVVDLEADGMPPCLILKRDGATLYATRDIAAALYRADTYHFAKALYIVAYQQDLHFRQWFRVVEKMGYPWAGELAHVSFGMVSFEGRSLSTREGRIVYLDDLLARAVEKALAVIREKSPDLPREAETARQVGIGAVVYQALCNNRIKDVDFRWDRALNFDGETGPYVQYTHARCCSLLRKARENGPGGVAPDFSALADDEAQETLRMLSRFPDTVREAAERYEPSLVTRHITRLCQAYNKYYYEHRVLEGEPGAVAAKLRLTEAARDVIRLGLWLIGMDAPERM